jgi:hypothetical protein
MIEGFGWADFETGVAEIRRYGLGIVEAECLQRDEWLILVREHGVTVVGQLLGDDADAPCSSAPESNDVAQGAPLRWKAAGGPTSTILRL